MTSVQCPDVQTRPTECLEWTRVTLDALQQLVRFCRKFSFELI